MFTDLYDYLKKSEQINDEFDYAYVNNIIYHFKELQKFPFIDLPAIYILDYRTQEYLFVSDAVKKVLGYHPQYFIEGALPSTLDIIHTDDFIVFSQKCFIENLHFLSSKPSHTHNQYVFSANYRIKHNNKDFFSILQKTTYLHSSGDGKPVIAIGSLTPLESQNKNIIINTIEKNIGPSSLMPAEKISETCYYPNPEYKILSKRELEIIKWMTEGFSSKQIADKLQISMLTVKKHRSNILFKTNSKNSNEAIHYAFTEKLL